VPVQNFVLFGVEQQRGNERPARERRGRVQARNVGPFTFARGKVFLRFSVALAVSRSFAQSPVRISFRLCSSEKAGDELFEEFVHVEHEGEGVGRVRPAGEQFEAASFEEQAAMSRRGTKRRCRRDTRPGAASRAPMWEGRRTSSASIARRNSFSVRRLFVSRVSPKAARPRSEKPDSAGCRRRTRRR
jgi:hypothetical protein